MFLGRSYFFIISDKTINKSPSNIMFRATVSAATVINRVSSFWLGHKKGTKKSQILARILGSGPHNPTKFFWELPSHPQSLKRCYCSLRSRRIKGRGWGRRKKIPEFSSSSPPRTLYTPATQVTAIVLIKYFQNLSVLL